MLTMRIAVISDNYPDPNAPNRAAGAFVERRVRGYLASRQEVLVVAGGRGGWRAYESGYEVRAQGSGLSDALVAMAEWRPDVVAVHAPVRGWLSGAVVNFCLDRNVPYVVWIHGFEALYASLIGYVRGWKRVPSIVRDVVRLKWLRKALENARSVVCVSKWMRDACMRNTGAVVRRVKVIPNPVDTETFMEVARSNYKGLRAVSTRGLEWKYGVDVAIRSVAGLEGVELTVIGSGSMLGEYRRIAAEVGARVTFLNSRFSALELAALYAEHDVFLAPSRIEAQGLAMCEAMATGMPVVASAVGGIPEFVRDGATGLLFERDDWRRAAELLRLMRDRPHLRLVLGREAARTIRTELNLGRIVQEELAVLEEARRVV